MKQAIRPARLATPSAGLGCGFLFALREDGAAAAKVALPPLVAIGCAFLMVLCLALCAASLTGGLRLSERVGWGMLIWYCLYLSTVLLTLAFSG